MTNTPTPSSEEKLHAAICNAVEVMNMSIAVATDRDLLKVHNVLRTALMEYEPAASKPLGEAVPVAREFVNELGNRIKITIEGPTSTSENTLTPMEAAELRRALWEFEQPSPKGAVPLTKKQVVEIAARVASNSLNMTRVHELGQASGTRTIMEDKGLVELARAIEAAHGISLDAADGRQTESAPPRIEAVETVFGVNQRGDFRWLMWKCEVSSDGKMRNGSLKEVSIHDTEDEACTAASVARKTAADGSGK